MPSAGVRMKGPKGTELVVEFTKIKTSISHKIKMLQCQCHTGERKRVFQIQNVSQLRNTFFGSFGNTL